MVFTPPSVPPFPGDRNPCTFVAGQNVEGITNRNKEQENTGALAKSYVEILNILCIIVHNQKENEDDKSILLF